MMPVYNNNMGEVNPDASRIDDFGTVPMPIQQYFAQLLGGRTQPVSIPEDRSQTLNLPVSFLSEALLNEINLLTAGQPSHITKRPSSFSVLEAALNQVTFLGNDSSLWSQVATMNFYISGAVAVDPNSNKKVLNYARVAIELALNQQQLSAMPLACGAYFLREALADVDSPTNRKRILKRFFANEIVPFEYNAAVAIMSGVKVEDIWDSIEGLQSNLPKRGTYYKLEGTKYKPRYYLPTGSYKNLPSDIAIDPLVYLKTGLPLVITPFIDAQAEDQIRTCINNMQKLKSLVGLNIFGNKFNPSLLNEFIENKYILTSGNVRIILENEAIRLLRGVTNTPALNGQIQLGENAYDLINVRKNAMRYIRHNNLHLKISPTLVTIYATGPYKYIEDH